MRIRCICPPKGDGVRHPDGDDIEFRERMDFRSSLAIRNSIAVLKSEDDDATVAEILAVLTEAYLLYGIASWTVQDAKGKPVTVSKAAIREHLLSKPDIAMEAGDEADALYAEAVMLPLLAQASSSLEPSPTDESTSPTKDSPTSPPKRSRPSSISTIPTAVTATTTSSLDGDSSLSPSSTSAA